MRVRAGLIVAGSPPSLRECSSSCSFRSCTGNSRRRRRAGLLRGVQAIGAIGAGLALGLLARRSRAGVLAAAGMAAFGVLGLLIWNGSPGHHRPTPLHRAVRRRSEPRRGRDVGAVQRAPGGRRGPGRAGVRRGHHRVRGRAGGRDDRGRLLGDRVSLVALLNVQAGLYLLAAAVAAKGLAAGATAKGLAAGATAKGLTLDGDPAADTKGLPRSAPPDFAERKTTFPADGSEFPPAQVDLSRAGSRPDPKTPERRNA